MTRPQLTVATWNVHGFVGMDGRRDPERAVAVLASLDADVVALQEVDGRDDVDVFERLGRDLGYYPVAGVTLAGATGGYGNLLLTREPARHVEHVDLSLPDREPRGAIDATLEHAGVRVRIFNTHFGLRRQERAIQARRLCAALDARDDVHDLVVLLGDLNEWRPPFRTGLAPLLARFAHRSTHRTFPARLPLLRLDRVLVDDPNARVEAHVPDSPLARAASDHLPLRAGIQLDAPP